MHLFNFRNIVSMFLGLCLLFAGGTDLSYAQESEHRVVHGVVHDTDGFPVIGAGVVQDGTTKGVVTDAEGRFSIQLPKKPVMLKITSIGYKTLLVRTDSSEKLDLTMEVEAYKMDEVSVIAYGYQKKETVTGAISSIGTDQLLTSPNSSLANTLAGQLSGVSTLQVSGQPGRDNAKIFVRGTGSLSDDNSSPLILVDGIEMDFFQMDPNEIENVTVLKDASATAVFGVRGANGVILVTTKRGSEGKPKVQWSSSVGMSAPTRLVKVANSYDTAMMYNEMERNDGSAESDLSFSPFVLEAFRTHSDPLIFPDINWYDYMLKKVSVQTQHNINVSGGTKRVKYFASVGFLYQDGLMKDIKAVDYKESHSYTRYNYRANLDIDVTNTTNLRLSVGGIVGNVREPLRLEGGTGSWHFLGLAQPFASPGIVDGHFMKSSTHFFGREFPLDPLTQFFGAGYKTSVKNHMNMNLELSQKLDFITRGLSLTVKGAFNTSYSLSKNRSGSVEIWTPYYKSSRDHSGLMPGDPDFDYTIVYEVEGENKDLSYSESDSKNKDWYLEAALRYNRKFKEHNLTALLLYNQSKKYYPSTFPGQPAGYVGFVGRVTYNYASKYMAEFNCGYNGSENFAPKNRYGFFPAISGGWILTQEPWMKNQRVFNYLKIRATVGLVGSDNVAGGRYLYIPSPYGYSGGKKGYFFGTNLNSSEMIATEGKLANSDVTWEKALKQNYAIEASFLRSRLRFSVDYFREFRRDILTKRNTVPSIFDVESVLPNLNLGKVRNHGFEIELKWSDKVGDFGYHINANTSFVRNKIIEMDEIQPNEEYQRRTGRQRGLMYGYVAEGFYSDNDFNITTDAEGNKLYELKEGLPDPKFAVKPGDVKYKNLNPDHDNVINDDDMTFIGFPSRPEWTFGLNYGISYKGLSISMNWTGVTNRDIMLNNEFRQPFGPTSNRSLFNYIIDRRWTPETAETATMPRLSFSAKEYNQRGSDLYVLDGSYVRLKTVRIGYTISKGKFLRSLGMSRFSVNFTGYNLLTLDGLKIMDPEGASGNGTMYPITRTFNFGIVANFL